VSDAGVREGKKRLGRPPKDDKRLPLNLRISPDLRARLVALAEANRSSITEQVECLLDHAIKENLSRGAFAPSPKKELSSHNPWNNEVEKWRGLFSMFGRDITGIALTMCLAMAVASMHSNSWSRDSVKRTRRFPAKQAGDKSTLSEMEKVDRALQKSLTDQWGCLDDPYVFKQVADAAREVLEKIAPEGDPSVVPTPPRGIDPAVAVELMKIFGSTAAEMVLRIIKEDAGATPINVLIRACLGSDVVARLNGRLEADADPLPPHPSDVRGKSS
jgi:hypothetical protein